MIKQVRWLRVVVGALLIEVGLIVVTIPFILLIAEALVFRVVVPIACLVVPFVIAFFATRALPTARVQHAVLMGIVATVMYFALVIGTSSIAEAATTYGFPIFIVVNALRVVSAAAGGYAADRRAVPSTA